MHSILSPTDLLRLVANRARERRLEMGLRQSDVASTSGLALSTVQRFEAGRDVGFEAVVRIAFSLRAEDGFSSLFPEPDVRTLDDLLKSQQRRQRVRKKT